MNPLVVLLLGGVVGFFAGEWYEGEKQSRKRAAVDEALDLGLDDEDVDDEGNPR